VNKTRLTFGQPIQFERQIDYSQVYQDPQITRRESYLDRPMKASVQTKIQPHYPEKYENR
jgi:hypothetical protein